jgi:hypothetical protein
MTIDIEKRKSNHCVVGLRLRLRAGYPTNPSLIVDKLFIFSEAHTASYSMGGGGRILGCRGPYPRVQDTSSNVDRSGSVLQLILNNAGIITDKRVSEMGIRHGKKRKNGLRANGIYYFMKSGDLLIVHLNALRMVMNN